MHVGNNRFYIKHLLVSNTEGAVQDNNEFVVVRSNTSVEDAHMRTYHIYKWINNELVLQDQVKTFEFIHGLYYYKIDDNKALLRLRCNAPENHRFQVNIQSRDKDNKALKAYIDAKNFIIGNNDYEIPIVKVLKYNEVSNPSNLVDYEINVFQDNIVVPNIGTLGIYVYDNFFDGFFFNNVSVSHALQTDPSFQNAKNFKFENIVAMKNEYNDIITSYKYYQDDDVTMPYTDGSIVLKDTLLLANEYIQPYTNTPPSLQQDSQGYYIIKDGDKYYDFLIEQRILYLNGERV